MKPDVLESHSVILLESRGKFLMLKRAATKRFAPNRWTGVGGRVEANEYATLTASALRELREETGLEEGDVQGFTLRRAVLVARPGGTLNVLLYFTGLLQEQVLPDCPEGTLAWVEAGEMANLDIIETSRPVLPRLAEDIFRDPLGAEVVRVGIAVFDEAGAFQRIGWAGEYAMLS